MPVRNINTVDEVQSWVENAIEEDQWLILMLHIIGNGESSQYWWSEEKLDAFAAWVDTQNILVVTQQQGIELAAVPIPPSFILFLSGLAIIFMKLVPSRKILCKNL